jgi:hypothetical protein
MTQKVTGARHPWHRPYEVPASSKYFHIIFWCSFLDKNILCLGTIKINDLEKWILDSFKKQLFLVAKNVFVC